MPNFIFTVTQTVDGLPDPLAYPEELAPEGSKLAGAEKEVLMEFPNEETAKKQAVVHEDGNRSNSDVWLEHCPTHFMHSDSVGGLDVEYIGLATPEDVERIKKLHERYREE